MYIGIEDLDLIIQIGYPLSTLKRKLQLSVPCSHPHLLSASVNFQIQAVAAHACKAYPHTGNTP